VDNERRRFRYDFLRHDLGQRPPRQSRGRHADALGQQQLHGRHPAQRGHTRGGVKQGAWHGTLTLADGTTLQAAADGLALANAVRLLGDTTVDTQSNTLTLSGPISGTGGLDKIGSGTLTLTGASTYTGDTNVNEGVLNVSGSLVSAVSVNQGGTLT